MIRRLNGLLSMSKQTALAHAGLRKASTYKPKHEYPPAHYDEMPVPQGPWKAAYNEKQRRYTAQLLIGAGFLVFTIYFVATSGKIFFNWSSPPLPEEFLASGSGGECPPVVVKKCD